MRLSAVVTSTSGMANAGLHHGGNLGIVGTGWCVGISWHSPSVHNVHC